MGRRDKKTPIIDWLKKINRDSSIFTKRFFEIKALYDLYQGSKDTNDPEVSLLSFKRLIDSICTNGVYKNLKRKSNKRIKNKRTSEYILLLDNEVHLDVDKVNIYITRKRKNQYNSDSNIRSSHEDSPTLSSNKNVPSILPTAAPSEKQSLTNPPPPKQQKVQRVPTFIPVPVVVPYTVPASQPCNQQASTNINTNNTSNPIIDAQSCNNFSANKTTL